MSDSPAVYDFTVQRRSDKLLPMQFLDGDENAVNLTGYSVKGEVWDFRRTVYYGQFIVDYTDPLNGEVSLLLRKEDTLHFPKEVFYDIKLIDPNEMEEYWLEGTITVSEGYTS